MIKVPVLTPDLSDKYVEVKTAEAAEIVAILGGQDISWESYNRLIFLITALDKKFASKPK